MLLERMARHRRHDDERTADRSATAFTYSLGHMLELGDEEAKAHAELGIVNARWDGRRSPQRRRSA